MRHAEPGGSPDIRARDWFDRGMSVAEDERRSRDRAATYLFRMSHDDKRQLQARARASGMTMQGFLEHLVLGREAAPPRRSGPKRRGAREIQEDLGISA